MPTGNLVSNKLDLVTHMKNIDFWNSPIEELRNNFKNNIGKANVT